MSGPEEAPQGGLSARAYSRVRGVSHVTVLKAIKSHRITLSADGTIDPVRADQEWARNTFNDRVVPAAPPPLDSPKVGQGDGVDMLFKKGKAKEQYFRGQMAELEFNLANGQVIKASVAGEFASSISNIIRDQVSAWADRLAPVVAAVTDETAVHRILSKESDALLRKVSKTIADAGY
jgi:hypothetical protein